MLLGHDPAKDSSSSDNASNDTIGAKAVLALTSESTSVELFNITPAGVLERAYSVVLNSESPLKRSSLSTMVLHSAASSPLAVLQGKAGVLTLVDVTEGKVVAEFGAFCYEGVCP